MTCIFQFQIIFLEFFRIKFKNSKMEIQSRKQIFKWHFQSWCISVILELFCISNILEFIRKWGEFTYRSIVWNCHFAVLYEDWQTIGALEIYRFLNVEELSRKKYRLRGKVVVRSKIPNLYFSPYVTSNSSLENATKFNWNKKLLSQSSHQRIFIVGWF